MSKHKRIKALPVCSETLRKKCAAYIYCRSHLCGDECPAFSTIKPCSCARIALTRIGCPYFRKAGDK